MDAVVRKHLSVIIAVTLVGIVTAALLLQLVHDSAASMGANQFSMVIFLVPCAIMLVGSFVIAATARQIGRQLYLVVLVICLVTGIVSMVVTSGWLSDPSITALLMANSPEDTVITPILQSPITIFRDIAAYVVIPTVGCIFGAWLGSR
ncbi:MAG: hypothetical protein IJ111_10175, partial [Eggerthellaceae bacterium]|nr:hypothetical protein [Eggerthellaceae bacterium]